MQHIDDETLALLALGEDVLDDDARAHLASCAECADGAARLARVADAFDGADAPDELVEPSPAVWSAIHAELGLAEASADLTAPSAGPDAPAAGTSAVVVPLAPRRRRVWVPVAAASAALLVGVAGGVLWERREAEPPETTVASATLDARVAGRPLPVGQRVERRAGHRRLRRLGLAPLPQHAADHADEERGGRGRDRYPEAAATRCERHDDGPRALVVRLVGPGRRAGGGLVEVRARRGQVELGTDRGPHGRGRLDELVGRVGAVERVGHAREPGGGVGALRAGGEVRARVVVEHVLAEREEREVLVIDVLHRPPPIGRAAGSGFVVRGS